MFGHLCMHRGQLHPGPGGERKATTNLNDDRSTAILRMLVLVEIMIHDLVHVHTDGSSDTQLVCQEQPPGKIILSFRPLS